jgi:hypothetical protein
VGGIVGFFVLPSSSSKAYFLSPEERQLAYHRMATDSSMVVESRFNARTALLVFRDEPLWPFYMIIGFCLGVPLYSVSNFLPQIVARFGYSAVKTNLYTVAPNVVGACFVVGLAFSSDFFMDRSIHIAACLAVTCIGFIILATVNVSTHIGIGYFACFLLCAGCFIVSPLLSTWYNNNTLDENQRAVLTPVMVASANTMGLVSSNIFTPASAPNYVMASVISACFGAVGVFVTLGLGLYMRADNRRRNREQGVNLKAGDVPTSSLVGGTRDPRFRWMGGVQF